MRRRRREVAGRSCRVYNDLMVSRSHLAAALATLAVIGASVTLSARLTKQEADQFSAKLSRIVQTGNAKPVKTAKPVAAQPLTTQITDNELNAYFKYNAKEQIPVGIVEPTINALGEGRVGGRAVVDLDAVRKQKQRGWLDPLGYMTGRLPITATGRLATKEGVGTFTLETAGRLRRDDSEDRAAGAPQLLLAHGGRSRRDQHGRPLPASRAHPGNSRRQGDRDNRAMRRASGARRS